MSDYLSYKEFKAKQRLNRYMRQLSENYDPHAHAARARRGMGIQKCIRGLGTKAKALWAAALKRQRNR